MQDSAYPYAQVIEEYQSQGSGPKTLSATYTFADDLVSQTRYDSAGTPVTSYIQADGFGSTRWLTDNTGTITDSIDYDAFGVEIRRNGTAEIEHLYRAERFDPNLAMYDLRARLYDPANGRFLTQDDFAGFGQDPQSLHKYSSNHNDPINRVDPSGHISLQEISIGVRLYAMQTVSAVTPVFYAASRFADRLNSALLAQQISMWRNGLLRFVGVRQPGNLVTGQAFERWLNQAMQILGGRYQQTINILGQIARPDWIVRGSSIVDAKLGQSLNVSQLQIFVQWAAQRGGTVTYVTLSRVPPEIVKNAVRIGAQYGVEVKFVMLWPF